MNTSKTNLSPGPFPSSPNGNFLPKIGLLSTIVSAFLLSALGWRDYHIPVENTSYMLQNDISKGSQLPREYRNIKSEINSGNNSTTFTG